MFGLPDLRVSWLARLLSLLLARHSSGLGCPLDAGWQKEPMNAFYLIANVAGPTALPHLGSWSPHNMRLINASTFQFQEFFDSQAPRYAILSHTWGTKNLTFKKGYQKIVHTCPLAAEQGLEWVWVDTCCIDESSSAELTEDAAYCLFGIFDVNMPLIYCEGSHAFQRLQEEIMLRSNDTTILLWEDNTTAPWKNTLLASSSADFSMHLQNRLSAVWSVSANLETQLEFSMTNKRMADRNLTLYRSYRR
ncbi:hypothetical protein B0H63DRAFT_450586 [Podospora didyma]|uniref:DUF8212 domain-containing protein n=1 Tax=Podospora didyma TaxID=330526 RepID=A0AAE0NGR9_9PEZI|nr:hypothetical protein B0H63DRAFT_450586 [Podospora didyma]